MNEFLFLLHIWVVIAFVFIALRMGKGALMVLVALQGVFANLFIVKQMSLFGFSVTCSDVFAIGGILSLNLLQEYFGREAARKTIRISLLSLLFFVCMSQIHLLYAPIALDGTQGAFSTIFSSSLRIVFSSMITFCVVQQFDIRLFPLLKGKLPFRVGLSLLCSQLLDTLLFTFLGLYGLVESLFDVIFVSVVTKSFIILMSAPFIAFAKRVVRHEFSI